MSIYMIIILNMDSPVKCRFVVRGSDPDIQRRDKRLCVPVMVHPTRHLVPSSSVLQHRQIHTWLTAHKTMFALKNDLITGNMDIT